ncbi:MAG: hypothetical protein A3H96_11135 [Acidobacteria bacterium RIFCSPLOWO2_02_FULL_67_36]|nr:MAG: hypothetical protein A3H96_11135 [Acidobacteria bacterium RIFCSPLOWO2_02_FULL_67_36]OFW24002.1 MAG: hypothetical protein A3G21_03505 [Acidobacteria bacterium RIFCSPLOWO2_12_FULL_66_21]
MRSAAGGPGRCWFVPGRIEVLGKHTDYAGGRSLVCAVEYGFCLIATPRDDGQIVIRDLRAGSIVTAALDPALSVPPSGWANYVMTVARRVARDFSNARRGADVVLTSDLPRAAGMSSSSAMMIALFLVLADVNGLERDPAAAEVFAGREALAAYLAAVENGQGFGPLAGDRGVGTSGGSEDHTAILCSEAGSLAQYAFRPVRRERTVPLDPALVFAIGVSGVRASKTGSALVRYNDATGAVQRMLDVWRTSSGRDDPVLADALSSAPDAAARLRDAISRTQDAGALTARLDQFIEESDTLVPAAAGALARGDLSALGEIADRSQALAERGLGNQVPETIELARSARRLGAIAASAFGAGFGGSVWALVPATDAARFADEWAAVYRRQFQDAAERAAFLVTRPGPAALRVDGGQ